MVSAIANERSDTTVLLCIAVASFVCSVFLIMTYFMNGTWKFEHKGTKRIIFIMSIFTALHGLALCFVSLHKEAWFCSLQSAFIQFFGMGSFLFQAALSMESFRTLLAMMNSTSETPEDIEFRSQRRFGIFTALICLFGSIGVLVISVDNSVGAESNNPYLCYIKKDMLFYIFAAAPLLLSCIIMFVCNSVIMYQLLSLYRVTNHSIDQAEPRETISLKRIVRFVGTYRRLTRRARLTLRRMVMLPMIYLVISLITISYAEFWLGRSETGGIVASCASVSSGIVNFIVWVLLDPDILLEWYLFVIYCGSDQRRKLYRKHMKDLQSTNSKHTVTMVQNATNAAGGFRTNTTATAAPWENSIRVHAPTPHDNEHGHGRGTVSADSLSSFILESEYSGPDLLGSLRASSATPELDSDGHPITSSYARPDNSARPSLSVSDIRISSLLKANAGGPSTSATNPLHENSNSHHNSANTVNHSGQMNSDRVRQSMASRYNERTSSSGSIRHTQSSMAKSIGYGGFMIQRTSLTSNATGTGGGVGTGPGGLMVTAVGDDEDYLDDDEGYGISSQVSGSYQPPIGLHGVSIQSVPLSGQSSSRSSHIYNHSHSITSESRFSSAMGIASSASMNALSSKTTDDAL